MLLWGDKNERACLEARAGQSQGKSRTEIDKQYPFRSCLHWVMMQVTSCDTFASAGNSYIRIELVFDFQGTSNVSAESAAGTMLVA